MSIFNRRLILSGVLAACTASALLPTAAHAYGYGYRGGYGYGGYGYRGFGVGFGAGVLAGGLYGSGYYGGYYGGYVPRPYYVAPPVVYAPPPVYYPAPRVAYEVPPPAPRHVVRKARVVHRVAASAPAVCIPPVLTGPLPKAPLTP